MLFVNRKGRFISLCSLVDSGENQKRDTYFELKKNFMCKVDGGCQTDGGARCGRDVKKLKCILWNSMKLKQFL